MRRSAAHLLSASCMPDTVPRTQDTDGGVEPQETGRWDPGLRGQPWPSARQGSGGQGSGTGPADAVDAHASPGHRRQSEPTRGGSEAPTGGLRAEATLRIGPHAKVLRRKHICRVRGQSGCRGSCLGAGGWGGGGHPGQRSRLWGPGCTDYGHHLSLSPVPAAPVKASLAS